MTRTETRHAGGTDADNMYGGAGDDDMGGGSGDNYMTGDEGADTVCGDGGLGQKNNIYAGDTNNGSVDRLWGGGTGLPGIPGDWAYCGSSSTYWGEVDDTTDCNGAKEIYTKPGDCPI